MLQLRNLLSGRRLLYGVLGLAVLAFVASQLLTTCGTRSPAELSRQAERRVKAKLTNARSQARADSVRARQALAHAAVALDSAKFYQDSLAYLQHHEKDIIHVSAADTAHYQGVLSDIFGR